MPERQRQKRRADESTRKQSGAKVRLDDDLVVGLAQDAFEPRSPGRERCEGRRPRRSGEKIRVNAEAALAKCESAAARCFWLAGLGRVSNRREKNASDQHRDRRPASKH